MTDKIGDCQHGWWSDSYGVIQCADCGASIADALAALRVQRDELDAIACRLVDQRDEPGPGSGSERLHYWRDKAINAARHLRNLKSQEEQG